MNDKEENSNVVDLHPQPKRESKRGRRKLCKNDPLTQKQEAFSRLLAAGEHFDSAYRKVYNCDNMNSLVSYKRASREQYHPKIQARVKELKEQARLAYTESEAALPQAVKEIVKYQSAAAGEVVINQRFLIDKALHAYNRADELGQASAMIASVAQLGKITGLVSDNREATRQSELEQMDLPALKEFITQKIHEISQDGTLTLDLSIIDMKPVAPKSLN